LTPNIPLESNVVPYLARFSEHLGDKYFETRARDFAAKGVAWVGVREYYGTGEGDMEGPEQGTKRRETKRRETKRRESKRREMQRRETPRETRRLTRRLTPTETPRGDTKGDTQGGAAILIESPGELVSN